MVKGKKISLVDMLANNIFQYIWVLRGIFPENKDIKPTILWTLIICGFNFYTRYLVLPQKKEIIEKFN